MSDIQSRSLAASGKRNPSPLFIVCVGATAILACVTAFATWKTVVASGNADEAASEAESARRELETARSRSTDSEERVSRLRNDLRAVTAKLDDLRVKLDSSRKTARLGKYIALERLSNAFDVVGEAQTEDVEVYRRNIARRLAVAFQKLGKDLSKGEKNATIETALAWSQMGHLLDSAGDSDDALRMHNVAIKNLERLMRRNPRRLLVHSALGISYFRRGIHLRKKKRYAAAVRDGERAVEFYRTVAKNSRNPKFAVDQAAAVVEEITKCYEAQGQNSEADRRRRIRREFLETGLRLDPKNPERLVDLYLSFRRSARYCRSTEKPDKAVKAYNSALETLQKLIALQPKAIVYREKAIDICDTLQEIHRERSDAKNSLQAAQTAKRFGDALRAENPDRLQHVKSWTDAADVMVNHHAHFGTKKAAQTLLEGCEAEFARLVKARPKDADALKSLARSQARLASRLAEWGEEQAAQDAAERGNKTMQSYLKRYPNDKSVLAGYATHLIATAALDHKVEQRSIESGVAVLTKLIERAPSDQFLLTIRAHGLVALGGVLTRKGRNREAISQFQAALTDFRALDKIGKIDVDQLRQAGFCAVKIGRLRLGMGQPNEARPALKESLGWLQRAIDGYAKKNVLNTKNAEAELFAAYARQNIISAYTGLARYSEAIPMSRDLIKWIAENSWIAGKHTRTALRQSVEWHLAMSLVLSKQFDEGLRLIRTVRDGKDVSAETLYNVACVLSVAAGTITNDSAQPPVSRKSRAEKVAAEAASVLRRLRDEEGFFGDPARISWAKTDVDLKFLRAHQVFGKLFNQLARPAAPPETKAQKEQR